MDTRFLVNALHGDAWIVAITSNIEALPTTLADVGDPYFVGWVDAEEGHECRPLHWYAKLGEIETYICAYKDATEAMAKGLSGHA